MRDVQRVDTTNVTPLQTIRDEVYVREFGIEDVIASSGGGNVVGEKEGKAGETQGSGVDWDVLSLATRKLGRFLVVNEAPEGNQGEEKVDLSQGAEQAMGEMSMDKTILLEESEVGESLLRKVEDGFEGREK